MTTRNRNAVVAVAGLLFTLPLMAESSPYTHFALIPAAADPSTIHFQSVKEVKVDTQIKATTDERYCRQEAFRDPGGSMYCGYTQPAKPAIAYRVTYSYKGAPMTSDEYGSRNFTFDVYFRPDELSPAVRRALANHTITRAAAEDFAWTTYRAPVQKQVIDNRTSSLCEGTYIDGNWTHLAPACQDRIAYRTVSVPSDYITVKVDPAAGRQQQVASPAPTLAAATSLQ